MRRALPCAVTLAMPRAVGTCGGCFLCTWWARHSSATGIALDCRRNRLQPIDLLPDNGVQRLRRRTFLTCSAAAFAQAAFPGLAWAVPKPYSWETSPPNGNAEAFVKWMVANRGEDAGFLLQRFSRYQTLVANHDVLDERNKRAFLLTPREEFTLKRNHGARLRSRLSRHRLRRDHLRPARRRPHDLDARREVRREGARGRHRLGLPVGLSRQPHRQGVDHRDHQAAGRAHARRLRRPDRARLHRVQRHHHQAMPTATTAGRRRGHSTRSSSPAASTTFPRRCCSSSSPAASW